MELSIAIVSYNARDELEACLASVFESAADAVPEVIVADNASSDDSVSMLRDRFPQVDVMESKQNVGFSRANNLCWRRARNPLVLFLNSDTVVPNGALARMVAFMNERPYVGALGPLLRNTDGSIQMSFGQMMSLSAELRQKVLNAGYRDGHGPLCSYVEKLHAREREVDWVSGACLLVRRTDAEQVGLLDEQFFLYLEDVDFCAALRRAGRQVWFSPDIEVVHHRGRSGATSPAATRTAYRLSQLAFYDKHHPSWAPYLRLYLRAKGELPAETPTASRT